MERYRNLGGDSNIHSFQITPESISVQFNDGSVYLYTNESAGAANISEMHQLARAGQGLNSFIKRVVNRRYAQKVR